MSLIERRYAEALIDISVENGAIDGYQQEFQNVVDVYNKEQELKFFLLNPRVNTDAKKDVLKKVFSDSVNSNVVNFLMLLLDKGRAKFLPGILEEFIRLADKKKNILNMTIISAAPLKDAQIDEIKEKYMKIYNASSVKVNVEVDESLIGGVKVKIGDRVVDGSIKGRLESLKELLAN